MTAATDRPWRILLVDDNAQDRADAKAALLGGSQRRYRFSEAALADEAVLLCAQAPLFDCMLLDFELPDGNALDVLARLARDADDLPRLPVVILTGTALGDANRAVLRAGAQDYVGKAWLGAESLTRAVENAVERHAMTRELHRQHARQQLVAEVAHAASGGSDNKLSLFERIGALVDADIQLHHLIEAGADGPVLRLQASVGLDGGAQARLDSLCIGEALCGQVAQVGRPIYRDDLQQSTDTAADGLRALGARACMCYPLLGGAQVVGTMSFASRLRDGFSRDDLDFMAGMAKQVALANERLRVDAELRDSEAFNASLLDSSIDCVKVLDLDGRIQHVNGNGQTLLELDQPDRVTGQAWAGLWPPAARAEVEAAVRSAALGQATAFEGACPTFKGLMKWWEVSVSPIREPLTEKVLRLLVISRDATARRADAQALLDSRERLRASEQELRTLTDNAPDVMTRFDRDLRHVFVNVAVTQAMGWRPDQVVGKTHRELGMTGELCELWERALQQVLATGEAQDIEFAFDGPTGLRDWAGRLVAEPHHNGRVEHVLGVMHDITERRQIEARREDLLEAERAARSESERVAIIKDEFLATLSHELRTPLAAIVGWANVLTRSSANADVVRRGVDAIARNGAVQARLIEDLLDMNRIVSGKLKMDIGPVDVDLVAVAAVDTLRPAAQAKGVTLDLAIAHDRAALVSGDATRLHQVLANLLGNALKFTPAGGVVTVATGVLRTGAVTLTVSDTGRGIEPKFVPFLFDRFSQADGSTARVHGGLGLGLSIVKQLVELHGGSVSGRSPGLGLGATFELVLPGIARRESAPPALPAPWAPPSAYAPLEEHHAGDLRGISVLLVDDQDDVLELARRLLCEAGARVVTAASASAALARLREELPDLLSSDIGMPGMDGYELIATVRNDLGLACAQLPAAAMSAFTRPKDHARVLQAGYQAYIEKPIRPGLLIGTVIDLAGARRPGAGAAD